MQLAADMTPKRNRNSLSLTTEMGQHMDLECFENTREVWLLCKNSTDLCSEIIRHPRCEGISLMKTGLMGGQNTRTAILTHGLILNDMHKDQK